MHLNPIRIQMPEPFLLIRRLRISRDLLILLFQPFRGRCNLGVKLFTRICQQIFIRQMHPRILPVQAVYLRQLFQKTFGRIRLLLLFQDRFMHQLFWEHFLNHLFQFLWNHRLGQKVVKPL